MSSNRVFVAEVWMTPSGHIRVKGASLDPYAGWKQALIKLGDRDEQ